MSAMMERTARVEAARRWFDAADASWGLTSWEDVDLVVQLGISDAGTARELLLDAPDALFSSWARLQTVLAEDASLGALEALSASVENRLKALTRWRASASAAGKNHDLADLGAEDLSRIARSGAVTAEALKNLVALSARRVIRGHADEIAAVLSGLSSEAPAGAPAIGVAVPDGKATPEPPAESQRVEPSGTTGGVAEASPMSWTNFAPFDYAAVAAQSPAPQNLSFTTTDDEQIEMTWRDVDTGSDFVLYRVKTSDEYAPTASTDLGDLIAVTSQGSAVDTRGFEAPVRHFAVWANRGGTEAEARAAQPKLVAEDTCVLPVRRCEVRVEDDGAVIGRWQPMEGVVRVDVLRLKTRVARQTSLYDPNYRLRLDQVSLEGFHDRDADPGQEYEYRVYVVAAVPGDGEEMSQPVMRTVRVPAVVHAVTDLRVTASPDGEDSWDLRWSVPAHGEVEIYRSHKRPAEDIGDETLTREAIERAQLSPADKLLNQPEHVGGEDVIRGVRWPSDWAKAYFTPITVLDEQQIRVGQTRIKRRPRPVSNVRLVERVDSQFLTFEWPGGMTSVRIFLGPGDTELDSPETHRPIMELSEDEYRKYGGAHLPSTLPALGCAVHLAAMTYSEGRAELSEPMSIQYPGLARVTYWFETGVNERKGRFARKGPTVLPRLMASCDVPITGLTLVLTHHESRLPLFLTDGQERTRAVVAFEVGTPTVVLQDVSARPGSGFLRLFADLPPREAHRVAVIDPSIDQLRCV